MNEDAKALYDKMQQTCLNKEVGPYLAWDAVNLPMIRHWCEAMGDKNPLYTDREYAEGSAHGAIVAPPTMMQVWTMRGYTVTHPPGSAEDEPFAMFSLLEEAGYPAVVAVNCEQEYFAPIKEGDEIHSTSQIESISEEKTTALGTGFFITELSRHYNQNKELVGEMRFRVFKYKPHQKPEPVKEGSGKPPKIKRLRPILNGDNNFFWDGVKENKLLIQRCTSCETLRHPPGPMCPHCQSMEWDTVESSGKGEVFSYVVMHYPPIPPFDYPNPIALIELEEGSRLVTQLDGITDTSQIEIGMKVEVVFKEVEEDLILPMFKPAAGE